MTAAELISSALKKSVDDVIMALKLRWETIIGQ
jgi:hypothetical protein